MKCGITHFGKLCGNPATHAMMGKISGFVNHVCGECMKKWEGYETITFVPMPLIEVVCPPPKVTATRLLNDQMFEHYQTAVKVADVTYHTWLALTGLAKGTEIRFECPIAGCGYAFNPIGPDGRLQHNFGLGVPPHGSIPGVMCRGSLLRPNLTPVAPVPATSGDAK